VEEERTPASMTPATLSAGKKRRRSYSLQRVRDDITASLARCEPGSESAARRAELLAVLDAIEACGRRARRAAS
jgi:hypothetical protein